MVFYKVQEEKIQMTVPAQHIKSEFSKGDRVRGRGANVSGLNGKVLGYYPWHELNLHLQLERESESRLTAAQRTRLITDNLYDGQTYYVTQSSAWCVLDPNKGLPKDGLEDWWV